jgi:hypothetical protein
MKKPTKILSVCLAAVAIGAVAVAPSNGQQPAKAPQPTEEAIEIARLVGEIEKQQLQMVANQEAMEKKLASIAEELRLAKAMAARAK